jgi:ribosome maturation factor RimP
MGFGPFFVCARNTMRALEEILEQTLRGMGYELVDTQRSNGGRLLRIFIDKPGGVTIDDCASTTRHLQRVFAVEGIDYDRLEISSPGLDRPLRKPADFARFTGSRIDVRMQHPDATGRRHFVGTLQRVDGSLATLEVDGLRVELDVGAMERARLVPEV